MKVENKRDKELTFELFFDGTEEAVKDLETYCTIFSNNRLPEEREFNVYFRTREMRNPEYDNMLKYSLDHIEAQGMIKQTANKETEKEVTNATKVFFPRIGILNLIRGYPSN